MKRVLLVSAVVLFFAASASAATILSDEPVPGSVREGQTVAYMSRSCSASNAAKPFKVVTAKNGRRMTIGCFSEREAARK